ncbi:MAG TPA: Re/Si-specific NAD(P)(+) transhydrogenase subunit alpha [Vicinamibacterales bacterium]|jgi:NAD(P) transhydrogenase subunit alpha|nr:Re/Si-specific NAD(P)(+) transhydrogenase subunit alpha [Vicinamibacterales bacterium]
MIIGVVRESWPGERRVALAPASVPPLVKAGHQVLVESNAGTSAGFTDAAYTEKGATIVASRADVSARAEMLLRVKLGPAGAPSTDADLAALRPGQSVIAFLDPLTDHALVRQLAERQVSVFSMELMPRITRAQSMDALSSMATIAGYKAVLLAAVTVPRMFPMLMTAAGNVSAARAFVIGVGVAGLQAIATAKRLGAQVQAYDVRPAAKEQILSLGAKVADVPLETADAQDAGGYAKAQDESFYQRQRDAMSKVVAGSDIVITTAAIPGRKAPVLITGDMVRGMQPGSAIVDLAAERGGNCELTRADEVVVEGGVTILGPTNLPSTVPYHASQMYAKNITTFLLHLANKEGQMNWDLTDEITRETLVTHKGEVVHERVRGLLLASA